MVLPAGLAGLVRVAAFDFAAFALTGRADFFRFAAVVRLGRFTAFFLAAAFRLGADLRLGLAAARRADFLPAFGAALRFAIFFAFFAFLLRLAIAQLPGFDSSWQSEQNRPCRRSAGGMGG